MSGLHRKWFRRSRTVRTQRRRIPRRGPGTHRLHSKEICQSGSPDVVPDSGGCERDGPERHPVTAPRADQFVFLLQSSDEDV